MPTLLSVLIVLEIKFSRTRAAPLRIESSPRALLRLELLGLCVVNCVLRVLLVYPEGAAVLSAYREGEDAVEDPSDDDGVNLGGMSFRNFPLGRGGVVVAATVLMGIVLLSTGRLDNRR